MSMGIELPFYFFLAGKFYTAHRPKGKNMASQASEEASNVGRTHDLTEALS